MELPIDDDISIVYKVQCITILFNLAIAFQLKAKREEKEMRKYHQHHHQQQQQQQQRQHHDIDGTTLTNSMMLRNHWYQNSIALYELCYEVLNCGPSAALSSLSPSSNDGDDTATTTIAEGTTSNTSSIIDGSINPGLHFLMILTNNLGQCHDSLGNYDKARTCFEQLLSIQMYLVDTYGGCFENDGAAGTAAAAVPPRQHQHLNGSNTLATSSSVLKHGGSSHSLPSTAGMTPWEGFVSNTSTLVILLKRCASAA